MGPTAMAIVGSVIIIVLLVAAAAAAIGSWAEKRHLRHEARRPR